MAKETYWNGRKVFENIEYYDNGIVKTYSFVSDGDDRIYSRTCNRKGKLVNQEGTRFILGYIDDTTSKNAPNFRLGSTVSHRIFFPDPPHTSSTLFVKDGEELRDVFRKSSQLEYLRTVKQTFSSAGAFRLVLLLQQTDLISNKTNTKEEQLVYVVE